MRANRDVGRAISSVCMNQITDKGISGVILFSLSYMIINLSGHEVFVGQTKQAISFNYLLL